MNVRTYVRGSRRERGVWFFSLEANGLAAVLGTRVSYGLPYRCAEMRIRYGPDEIKYMSPVISVQVKLQLACKTDRRFVRVSWNAFDSSFSALYDPRRPLGIRASAARAARHKRSLIKSSGSPLRLLQRQRQEVPDRSVVQSASAPMPDPNRYVHVLICHRGSEQLPPKGF